jgi:hypothetical protein
VSGLEISLRAKDIAIANLWDSLRVSGMDSMDCAAFAIDGVLDAVGPLIVAAELRRLSQELIAEENPNTIWRAIGRRANELDPPVVGA